VIIFGRPTVSITPERQVYLPGEEVRALVQIRGGGALELQEIRVELRRLQRYSFQSRERDSKGHSYTSYGSQTDELVCDTRRIFEAGTLQEGMVIEQVVALRLPSSAEGSGNAGLLDTAWDVHLVLNRQKAIDVSATTQIVVLTPAALFAGRIADGWRGNQPAECAVAFQLPTRQVRAGGVLQGALIIHARKAIEARSLRVELARVEKTIPASTYASVSGRDDTTTVVKQPVAQGGTLPFDAPVTVPFTLPIPAAVPPTTFAARGTIRWLLRGVVDIRFASDYWGETEVNIYNGPDLPVAPSEMPTMLPTDEPMELARQEIDALPAPSTAARLVLIATAPAPLLGQTFTLDAPETTLGRRETNDIAIPDEGVSREHAAIRREGDSFFVRDLGSTGGTLVNNERLTGERALRDGDRLMLGFAASFEVKIVDGER
jgi:FHA domain